MVRARQPVRAKKFRAGLSRRRRRGRRGRRGRRSSGGNHYVETIPISIELGAASTLSYKLLVNRPKSMNFRVQYIHFVGQTAYTTSGDNAGEYAPAAIQISIYNTVSSGEIVATSGPVVLGNQPKNIKVHQPRQSDWCPYSQDDKELFGKIEAACLGKAGNASSSYIRGIVHVLVRFGPEIVAPKCIALQQFIDSTIVESDVNDLDINDEIQYLEVRLNKLKSIKN